MKTTLQAIDTDAFLKAVEVHVFGPEMSAELIERYFPAKPPAFTYRPPVVAKPAPADWKLV